MELNTKTKKQAKGREQLMADAMAFADGYLLRRYGVRWDDLGDIVLYADFPELTREEIKERCEEKVELARYYR